MKYGLPYKGSKNRLAERIVRLLPNADHLIDLFCGGCAVAHAALVMGKYQHVHINDLNWMCPTLFVDALNGKYANDTRWISRDDFQRLKDTDPYVAFVWSFGNNLRDYIYSRDIEPLKRAIHYAIFFGDYAPGRDLGYDFSFVASIPDRYRRYLAIKHYLEKAPAPDHSSLLTPNSHSIPPPIPHSSFLTPHSPNPVPANSSICNVSSECEEFKKKRNATGELQPLPAPRLQSRLESFERQKLITIAPPPTAELREQPHSQPCPPQSIPNSSLLIPNSEHSSLLIPNSLTHSVSDYASVTIPDRSVIYCDIPYINTDVYDEHTTFDYERFYRWCEQQTQPVFISSYDMPRHRFDIVAEYTHRSTISATANHLVTERIFVPRHQQERGHQPPRQLSLDL